MHILEIKALSFQIGGQAIFRGMDLAMEPHEIHALIGTNGSGVCLAAYSGQIGHPFRTIPASVPGIAAGHRSEATLELFS